MSVTITLPKEYSYVAASLVGTVFLLAGQSIVVSRARKAAQIPYPQLYAEKAEAATSPAAHKFNCAQRAHQNTLENMPVVVITTVITGLKYPVAAAAASGLWILSRIMYTRGYITGDPAKRNKNGAALGSLGLIGLLLGATYTVGSWIMESL